MHGANLNYLGKRDVNHYGNLSLQDIENLTSQAANKLNYELITYQSNHEGYLIDALQNYSAICDGIIINFGALSHYNYALYDALLDTNLPVIEVHLSDINQREAWRKQSVTAPACIKVIYGKKEQGYIEALQLLIKYLTTQHDK